MSNDGGPAFPAKVIKENHRAEKRVYRLPGMTLRDWFAGQALSGMIAGGAHEGFGAPECADASYQFADAMLAARDSSSKP